MEFLSLDSGRRAITTVLPTQAPEVTSTDMTYARNVAVPA